MLSNDEIVFELKGCLPKQMPLKRLAAYMSEFASMLGGNGDTMFSDIREGSICIVAKPSAGQAIGQHKDRIIKASRNEGSRERHAAFQRICKMASEDRLPARIKTKAATIIHFPAQKPLKSALKVRDYGHVTGELSGIVKDKRIGVKARIRPLDGGPLVYCTASEEVGRELGNLFLSFVRVYGKGWWIREQDGAWICEGMEIEKVHKLENVTINEAVKRIRELDIEWVDDPLDFEEDAKSA